MVTMSHTATMNHKMEDDQFMTKKNQAMEMPGNRGTRAKFASNYME